MKTFFAQPLITEKSMALTTSENAYQFVVPTWATKQQVADFVARHFNVGVVTVTSATLSGERVRFRNKLGTRSNIKKMTVHISKGQTISDFSLPVETKSPETPTSKPKEISPQAEKPTQSKITVRSRSKKTPVSEDN